MPRFYYDRGDETCKKFLYGGCAGNTNNFLTAAECENRCSAATARHAKKIAEVEAAEHAAGNVCGLEAEVGNCRAAIDRWYHDESAGECRVFTWGGCGGNGNNFATKEKCEARCGGTIAAKAESRVLEGTSAPECLEEMKVGMCRGAMPRFYFNRESGKCEGFLFGGCDANGNNFETLESCTARCVREPEAEPEER